MKKILLFLFLTISPNIINAAPVHLVEISSFSCEVCRQAEDWHDKLEAMVNNRGGAFIFAPIAPPPAWHERVYYVAREISTDMEELTRTALFNGEQARKMGYIKFDTLEEIMTFLKSKIVTKTEEWNKIEVEAGKESSKTQVAKSVMLAQAAKVKKITLTFVLIHPENTLSIHQENLSLPKYMEKVMKEYKKASAEWN